MRTGTVPAIEGGLLRNGHRDLLIFFELNDALTPMRGLRPSGMRRRLARKRSPTQPAYNAHPINKTVYGEGSRGKSSRQCDGRAAGQSQGFVDIIPGIYARFCGL